MYVIHNIGGRWCYICRSGKAISITYCECVFVALGIQHATGLRHIVVRGLSSPHKIFFSHFLINGTILGKESY